MHSADGAITLIYNGEIYNYVELREELRARGHIFRTESDSEVLIAAWREWDFSAFDRLRGMFAFALWDLNRQILVLARDPFGKKPLFMAEESGRLVFASEIAPILEMPGLSRQIEPQALDQYLLNRYVPGPNTFFRAIRKLQPGSYAVWKDGRLDETRYFVPPLATASPRFPNLQDATAAFAEVFDEAVHIRMRSDAPYGAYLSGGIDSSAVVAAMTRHRDRVRTFAVGFADAAYSELTFARQVAAQFGAEHEELVVEPDSFLLNWPEAIRHRGAPVSEASDVPILMLSKAASRSVKMVLTGEGSDEMLGGYPKHRAEAWVSLYQKVIPGGFDSAIVSPFANLLPYRARRLQILLRVLTERDVTMRLRAWFGSVSGADRARLLGRCDPLPPPDPLPFQLPGASPLRRALFFDQTSWLPDNLLERGDRMMMAGSIEGRMPFMDTELAKVAAGIPDRFLIGRAGGKRVLREAFRNLLPEHILHRRKIGFRVPFHAWIRERYRDLLRDMLASDASNVARLCDRTALEAYVKAHLEGRRNHERVLWTLINLEMFLREFRPEGLDAMAHRSACQTSSSSGRAAASV